MLEKNIPLSVPQDLEYLRPLVGRLMLFRNNNKNKFLRLTARKVVVLDNIAFGLNNRQAADNLAISISTVQKHRANIKRKLEVKNHFELTIWALAFFGLSSTLDV